MIENATENISKTNPLAMTGTETSGTKAVVNLGVSTNDTTANTPANDGTELPLPTAESEGNAEIVTSDLVQAKLILEAALLSSSEPLQLIDLKKLFDQELSVETIRKLLDELKDDWSSRAVELTPVASGWRFRVKPEFTQFVHRMNPEKPPRYSRAVMETLAIIAYRQPATRGDIEQIRGVTVSTQIVKSLEERGWIEAVGHREVAGRPALYATTKKFLDDLNLLSLEELPSLDELQATLNLTTSDIFPHSAEAGAAAGQEEVAAEIENTPVVETAPIEIVNDTTHAPEETTLAHSPTAE
ncbi:MAG: SMC-Scp complex subunit ScpB [Pseudomonadota bacterium]